MAARLWACPMSLRIAKSLPAYNSTYPVTESQSLNFFMPNRELLGMYRRNAIHVNMPKLQQRVFATIALAADINGNFRNLALPEGELHSLQAWRAKSSSYSRLVQYRTMPYSIKITRHNCNSIRCLFLPWLSWFSCQWNSSKEGRGVEWRGGEGDGRGGEGRGGEGRGGGGEGWLLYIF